MAFTDKQKEEEEKGPYRMEEEDEEEEDSEEGEEEAWDDWEGERESEFTCLFCDSQYSSCGSLFDHCASLHHFDFHAIRATLNLDFYASFKLINFVRSQVSLSFSFLLCFSQLTYLNNWIRILRNARNTLFLITRYFNLKFVRNHKIWWFGM